jgi:hypothetical protein
MNIPTSAPTGRNTKAQGANPGDKQPLDISTEGA